jgi:micrococcal nuclease
MQQLLGVINSKVRVFQKWAKKHRALTVIVYTLVIVLAWPVVVAYILINVANRKFAFNAAAKSLTIALAGFGLFFNTAWVYGIANPQSAETQATTQAAPTRSVSTSEPAAVIKAEEPKNEQYRVIGVIDGDTIKVDLNGKVETVRLIGVDTPETVDPRETVQCFGLEASTFTKNALNGKSVKLETDASQGNLDKYNRLLRYVILEDGTNFNKSLLTEGYAYEYTYNIPYKYQAEFKAAQKLAEGGDKGLWAASACDGKKTKPQVSTPNTAPQPVPNPTPVATPASSNCDPNYTPCVPVSSSDLDCADIGVMVKIIGTDVHKFDRNKDGYGCESYQ